MEYTIEKIKSDIKSLDSSSFFDKYYMNDDYWYFDKILNCSNDELNRNIRTFKTMISECFHVKEAEVFLVGSAKLGFSLSPPKNDNGKLFQAFRLEGEKPSDLDIAIISETLFNKFWWVYRNAKYHSYNDVIYKFVYVETYRGFINSENLQEFSEGRKAWNQMVKELMKRIFEQFYIKHEIAFRIYRNIEDFKQYHKQGIEKIKRLI